MNRILQEKGFTLIEIIVVMIILCIVAIVLGNAIVYGVRGYVFAHQATQSSQKAQLALGRLNTDLFNITAVSYASANRIDFTIPKALPSCTVDAGCQYRITRTGSSITMEGMNPVVASQVLLDGLNATNGGKTFLQYCKQNDSSSCTWTYGTDPFKDLASIKVQIALDFPGGNPLYFQQSINPRENGLSAYPSK